jgi:hypothetical protein
MWRILPPLAIILDSIRAAAAPTNSVIENRWKMLMGLREHLLNCACKNVQLQNPPIA